VRTAPLASSVVRAPEALDDEADALCDEADAEAGSTPSGMAHPEVAPEELGGCLYP
jgi:hypothetical protein